MKQIRFRCSKEDLITYLEYKIESNIATDDEYEMYVEYQSLGYSVLLDDEYKYTRKKLVRELRKMYEE